jgi:cell division protein FtsW (lipid II flippase)
MWDAKRQTIWLTTAIALATFVVYQDAHDEAGRFDPAYFALLEIIFLLVIIIMFYIYSRKNK